MTKVTNIKLLNRRRSEEDLRYKRKADETASECDGAKRGTDNDCGVCS